MQFISFVGVGAIGFLIDSIVLQLTLLLGLGLYDGRVVSFLTAATATWRFNRRYTFQATGMDPKWVEWIKYVALATLGGALNYAAYVICVSQSATAARWPVLGVGVGSFAGLIVNFLSSKFLVFRSR